MKNVLNTISQTVCTARIIFQNDSSRPSLILRVLGSIQADYSESGAQSTGLSDELLLSTKSLLTQLTSSANFQLLPPNLRSYKPYIDLNSSSTSLSQSEFSQKLQDWFHNSCKQWQQSSEKWLSGLQSVKDIWSLRASLRRCTMESGLEEVEKDHVHSNLDLLCHRRISAIWQRTLSDAESKFKEGLRKNIFSVESQRSTGSFMKTLGTHLTLIVVQQIRLPWISYSSHHQYLFCRRRPNLLSIPLSKDTNFLWKSNSSAVQPV